MKEYKNKILYIVMFFIIFSTDTFIVFANINTNIKTLFQLSLGIITAYVAFYTCVYSRSTLFYWLIIVLSIIGSMIYNDDFSKGNLFKIIIMTMGMVFANGISLRKFSDIYVKIVTFICSFSLLTYSISFVFDLSGMLPIIENTEHVKMIFIGVSNVSVLTEEFRNYGPFWEPGVYSIYLTLAILFVLVEKKKITTKIIILTIGVVTTFSTAGYAAVVVLIIYYALSDSEMNVSMYSKRKKLYFMILSLVGLGILLSQVDMLNTIILSKLNSDSASYASTVSRIYSISGNIEMWLDNPIFGVGPTKLNDFYEQYLFTQGLNANSNTNGLLIMFSMYGTVLGIMNVYGVIKLATCMDKTLLGKIIIFSLLLIMLFAEPLQTSCLFNILIFYGLISKPKEERDKNYA